MGRDPLEEAEKWQERISALDNRRKRYQEMAAEGLIEFAELKERLQELEEEKTAAQREFGSHLHKGEQLEEMRRNKDELLEHLKGISVRQVDSLSPDERRRVYQIVGLRATTKGDGTVEVDGDLTELCFGILESTSPSRA